MDEMGLAQGMAGPQKELPKNMGMLREIVAMIMQGAVPEELIAQGVPEELVMAAMEEISKQLAQVPPEQAGLAATVVRPERDM